MQIQDTQEQSQFGAKPAPPKRHNPYIGAATSSQLSSPALSFQPFLVTSTPMEGDATAAAPTPFNDLQAHRGKLAFLARNAAGSSFIQSCLRDASEDAEANYEIICGELLPEIADLLLDCHGCYVIRTLMEKMNSAQLEGVTQKISQDEALQFSLCTHSLHTRRVAQFLMESVGADFLAPVLLTRCDEVATTQQGCIVIQRAMDLATPDLRRSLLNVIYANAFRFSIDPFANYVIQHALEVDSKESSSAHLGAAFAGNIIVLSCNKFASNVIEKCLSTFVPDAQHKLIEEMYSASEETLLQMMHDSFGNYIIQSSIALASQRDISMMAQRLTIVIRQSPFGHKIEARLERRLKGKQLQHPHHSSHSHPHSHAHHQGQHHHQQQQHHHQQRHHPERQSHGRPRNRSIPFPPTIEHSIEEPW